jgi:copper homeostasis protein
MVLELVRIESFMPQIPKLEIVVDSLLGVQIASQSGAQRVELCSSFVEGGITPSYGLIALAVQQNIAVNVLVRPRAGDSVYSSFEVEVMLEDIFAAKRAGANGVVIGALTNNFELNLDVMKSLIAAASPLEITFHRAFDVVADPFSTLEELVNLGVNRILTSGQQLTAEMGIPLLKKLVNLARDRLIILPAAGINASNAKKIWQQTGVTELHFSAFETLEFPISKIPAGKLETRTQTSANKIQAVLESLV